jgi:hypothetical protein
MDLAALGAVGAVETRGVVISILYWKIGHSASGRGGKRYIFVTPWDIRTYGDSEVR